METKGQTTSNARGTSFELRMCMLLFVRGLIKQKNNFKLEYQVPAAQKFDDLVFHNDIDDIYFFQLKHNEKGIKKVNHTQMFNNTSKQDKNLLKGNFILLKYVKSVIDLQKSDVYKRRLKNAFVFTNMDLDVNEQDQLILGDDPKKLYFGVNSIQLTKLNLPSNHILNGSNSDQKTKFYKFCNDKNIIKILKRQADTEFYANKMDQNLFLDDAETDDIKNKAYAAIELLEQFSLITRNELILKDNEKKTIIKIHRLVQTVIQYKYKANKQQSLENAIKLVAPEVFTAYNNFKNKNISRYKFNKSMRNLKPEAPIHLNKIENNINSKKGENRDLIEKYKIFFKYIDKFSLEKIVLKDDLVYLKKIDKSKGFWESFVKFNGTRLIQNDCINILKYLIKEEIIPINLTNKDGKTLLHIAASLGNLEIVEFLINNKAEKNANDVIGKTPLHHAIKNESEEVFSYLIKEKVDVNAKDNKGRTPLFSAIEVDNLHMFETLIKEGADANVKDNNRQTLLFEAMSYKKLENSVWNDEKKKINAGQITKLLVEKFNVDKKPKINLKNNQGSTPLDIAKKELSAEDYNKVKKCLENINVTKNIK
uniref:CSON009862 protein n=1 Tax=Culicoides sonorensis TaxID=179676 RepID=A0A336N0B5_CULSO